VVNNKYIYKALGFGLVGVIGLLLLVDTFFEHQFYLKLRQDGFTASGKVVNIEKVSNGTSGVSWDYTVEYDL